ncbi:hypothetical protein METBIDRAFT_31114 [Metschnikowia bicuspidata var. bicuspidata NRRL YB-4993]|uniref:Uncharacterized protein n=1 Tax=Metschnikowia bicuspidata var. bicuspidata NRRL YB-4993 TaxID=869754 RepID=A0A1A0HDK2_9ASCO|nr:hypothetical protein METBIDRAFT_31114 [Metschnikowia bicuspidata var. bicuspidata NRRL YB-4993]OBA22164.1 hypothetical protein METBIDRAFT_31114 [Metschnikowia bicuspidata var. bicuspidata NRRL YB-4993]
MDTVNQKQPPGPQMRRGYYGDDHELFRQNSSLDLKYPFPQPHLFPPSLSVRGGPLKMPSSFPLDGNMGQDSQATDPRYVPQDFVLLARELEDKRYKNHYGFLGSQGQGTASLNNGINPPPGMNAFSNGAGATSFNVLNLPPAAAPVYAKTPGPDGLVAPIPPLHVQHEHSSKEDADMPETGENTIHSKCSRCKKDFVQRLSAPQDNGKGKSSEPKIFKLCFHCRDLQRQRSRRWQMKTKDKQGACRRCGSEIPVDQQRFVLCPQCRKSLRIRKANRAAQGRCVHCSGPISSLIIKDDSADGDSSEEPESRRSSEAGSFKVCQRCRENDKIRRNNLERMGNCNRCAKALDPDEQGRHKVCFTCRQKKKKQGGVPPFGAGDAPAGVQMHMSQGTQMLSGTQHMQQPPLLQPGQALHHASQMGSQNPGSHMHDMGQNVMVPSMNYVPMEQNTMLMHPGAGGYNGAGVSVPLQEMHMGYAQQMQPMVQGSGDMYKPPMTQLPLLQPHMDLGYQQFMGYPPVGRNGLHYSSNRM